MSRPPRIMIATPTAGGVTTVAYAKTLIAATIAIHEAGGGYRHLNVDGADVVIARNLLAHALLQDESCTHILFIDSDMSVELEVLRHFLNVRKPMVGAAYSERRIDLTAFADAMAEERNEGRAKALASPFTVRMAPGKKTVLQQLCVVDALGFGCVLIAREVFTAMIAREIVKPVVSAKLAGITGGATVYDFFDPIALDTGEWLSEDYAFCRRVGALGDVDVLAYVGPGVGHVGNFSYSGPYLERMKAGKI